MRKALALCACLLALSGPVLAADPDEMLKDPAQEARAEKIGQGLRCLVCQSESIENSNADLARDLRVIVRERVKAGDSDRQVVGYVVARYGDYVLLKPPFKARTLVLWGGPFALLLGALGVLVVFFRRRSAAGSPPPLTPEEIRRLDALLKDSGNS
ncbi:MAG: cytochrome c-type biogenesis protein CcmH [Magnetospirillum sp.]|nr:cytochrome c-type biogenesis protein CcmH [Magnetospirillum sp.]